MLFVSGVDTFGRISAEKVFIELQSAHLFKYRNALLFRGSRIDRRFIDDNITFFQHFPDAFTRLEQRCQVRSFMFIDRCGYCNDEDIALGNIFKAVGELHTVVNGFLNLCVTQLQCTVMATTQFVYTPLGNVETDHFVLFAESVCQRQTYVAQTDDGQLCILKVGCCVVFHFFLFPAFFLKKVLLIIARNAYSL